MVKIAAFQNSVNLLMCNRVGLEGQMDFCGETVFVSAEGNIAALADDTEQLLFAELDLEGAAQVRERKQYLPLRRPEVFELG